MRRRVGAIAVGLVVLLRASTLDAQATHVLIVSGLSGEPAFARTFVTAAQSIYDAAKQQWQIADSSLIWLAEDPSVDGARIRGRSTREGVEEAFLSLSRRVAPGDLLFVLLIGHGSGDGPTSRVNLPGPDATAEEYATWLDGFGRQSVVFVNAASASGDFVATLRGERRVVVTATRTAFERNASRFAEHFARGLATGEADADKDGRVSVREAFAFADHAVAQAYELAGTLRSEHAVLSDSLLASRLAFGPPQAASSDPRVRALFAERQELESQVVALRERRDSLPQADYEAELERLLLAIAEKNAAIRALGGRP